ncbi:unnamed protein product, partial [Meganyctiphanes norvegica]
VHWNCRSLKRKKLVLRDFLRKRNPDIVALQETWNTSENPPKFTTYDTIKKDRPKKKGGGLMFIIKNTLTYRIKQITPYRDAKIEYQCITIISKKSETDILNMYIPPNTTLEQEEFLHYLNQLQNQFIICGDMNGRHRLWEPSSYRNNNPIGNVLCEILDNHDNITLATPPD